MYFSSSIDIGMNELVVSDGKGKEERRRKRRDLNTDQATLLIF